MFHVSRETLYVLTGLNSASRVSCETITTKYCDLYPWNIFHTYRETFSYYLRKKWPPQALVFHVKHPTKSRKNKIKPILLFLKHYYIEEKSYFDKFLNSDISCS